LIQPQRRLASLLGIDPGRNVKGGDLPVPT
jgi:hypothetical protein